MGMPKWESVYRMGMPRWKKNEAAVVEQRRLAFQDYLNEVLCSTTSTLSGQVPRLARTASTHRHRRACSERARVAVRVVQARVRTRLAMMRYFIKGTTNSVKGGYD